MVAMEVDDGRLGLEGTCLTFVSRGVGRGSV